MAARALAFHGRGSTPDRIRWLIDALEAAGLVVEAPSYGEVDEGYRIAVSRLPIDVVAGHSMGGTVAMLLAAKHPDEVRCVISIAGPVDRLEQLRYMKERGLNRLASEVEALGIEKLIETSPIKYLSERTPPILYIWGDRDDIVPITHLQMLRDAAKRLGFRLVDVVVEGMGHVPRGHQLGLVKRIVTEFAAGCIRT